MRKVLTFLGVYLCLAAVVPVQAQQAPDMFKDQDKDHWAYQAMESLRSKGIVVGYPDGYFRGRRTLTRYEFAVALDRALKKIQVIPGPAGSQGPGGARGDRGDTGPQGPVGVSQEELATLRRLMQEFSDELKALGNNMAAANRRIDGLAKDVADIKAQMARMPRVWGQAFVGMRSDNVNGAYVDKDGRINPLGNNQAVLHLFDLGIAANIAGGAMLNAEMVFDNYRNYLGGTFGRNPALSSATGPTLSSNVAADMRMHRLEIITPFGAVGRDGKLVLGRFGEHMGHLTLWKPDFDTYFDVPTVDDGSYTMDGAKITAKIGSLSTELVASQTASVRGVSSGAGDVNSPLAGTSASGTGLFSGLNSQVNKPIAQPNQGQMVVDQLLGLRFGLPIRALQGGHIGATALELSGKGSSSQSVASPGAGFNGVMVLGADANAKLMDKLTASADWGKSITHNGRFSTVNPHQNNAFNFNLGYKATNALTLNAGYRYIDPLFYAPGYWGRVGNWVNPTNVQGPTVRAGYSLMHNLGLTAGGDFIQAARGRANVGGLGYDDDIKRILVGLRWDVAKSFQTTIDWEGDYWTIQGPHSWAQLAGGQSVHPTEHYLRLGTGYHLTENTILKLMYEIGMFDGHGLLSEGSTGRTNTSNVITAQAAVKF